MANGGTGPDHFHSLRQILLRSVYPINCKKLIYFAEVDYPPQANAGSNIIINLPQNSVTLYGNKSTDDHGIVSYEWIKKSDDKLTADMKGVRMPNLQLNNLEVGDYTFTLKVTDTGRMTSTADVHVFVKPGEFHSCGALGKHLLSKNVAEIQLLTNHLCKHGLLALDL
jgi:hypothetical protein